MIATVEQIRAHFPALTRCEGGHPVAYFDGPGGTQVPQAVVDAMSDYLLHHNANTHWNYATSIETDAAILAARGALADYLGASAEEIAFGQNMTTLTFHLARGLARAWREGDEIVVTELDHQANVAPWQAVAQERGLALRVVPMNAATGRLDLADLEKAITPRTRLIAIGAASNALGTITDVTAATRIAHARGAMVFVDAVHFAAHGLVDVRAIDCDFLACSAYKFYGPHIGVLYGKRALIEAVDVPKLIPSPDTAPERLETGTLSHESMVGAAAAVDFIASLAGAQGTRRERIARVADALHARGTALFSRMWSGLSAVDGVTCYGSPPGSPRTPTIAFTVRDIPSATVASTLSARGVFVSDGDFYATTVVERLGRTEQGLVRAGCACYTTEAEVDRLVDGVREIAGR